MKHTSDLNVLRFQEEKPLETYQHPDPIPPPDQNNPYHTLAQVQALLVDLNDVLNMIAHKLQVLQLDYELGRLDVAQQALVGLRGSIDYLLNPDHQELEVPVVEDQAQESPNPEADTLEPGEEAEEAEAEDEDEDDDDAEEPDDPPWR